jgi:radical SAM superfamily enzyme YgiQ (UPF0313 family)
MSDLLLVNPLFLCEDPVEQRLMTPYFPLGLLYLAAVARQAGYSVALFDGMFAQRGDEAFVDILAREQPRVVGISVLATVRAAALRLAGLADRYGAMVIAGGADPTSRPETYLRHEVDGRKPVDLVVVGEGEETLLEVLPHLMGGKPVDGLGGVAGLAFLGVRGNMIQTPARRHCADLDSLPLLARDLIDVEAYRRAWCRKHGLFSLSLITSRGCPYGCTWCQKSVFGRSLRLRSPEKVAEEMRLIKEQYHPDQIRIVDDVLGIDRRWVRAWREAVLTQDAVVPFECLSRVDLVDDELIGLLRDAGCRRIAFGAESGSQKVLDAMDKGTRVEQIRQAAALCRAHGIETYFYVMVGYPGEEWADLLKTADLLTQARPDAFSSTIAYPLPGTRFYEEVAERLLDSPDWDYTAENRLLFERGFSTQFYRWVQRWLYQEWRAARLRHGEEHGSIVQRIRSRAALWRARAMVRLLRRRPAERRAS